MSIFSAPVHVWSFSLGWSSISSCDMNTGLIPILLSSPVGCCSCWCLRIDKTPVASGVFVFYLAMFAHELCMSIISAFHCCAATMLTKWSDLQGQLPSWSNRVDRLGLGEEHATHQVIKWGPSSRSPPRVVMVAKLHESLSSECNAWCPGSWMDSCLCNEFSYEWNKHHLLRIAFMPCALSRWYQSEIDVLMNLPSRSKCRPVWAALSLHRSVNKLTSHMHRS